MSKLEKLTIYAHKDKNCSEQALGHFVAMFNPESINRKYENVFSKYNIIGKGEKRFFIYNKISEFSLKLVLDGTGLYDPFGQPPNNPQQIGQPANEPLPLNPPPIVEPTGENKFGDVAPRVNHFIKLCWTINGIIHQPNFLKLQWGKDYIKCQLVNVDIKYTNFNQDGTPFRAELDIRLCSKENVAEDENVNRLLRLSSPDVSHSRIVKAGDTLPLLTKEIYGSSDYYLWVAEQNGLDNINTLVPGQRLVFPPLESAASR